MDKNTLTIALAGNPNCGKSTVFNNITGARQHVGNYPGVTVEKKEGRAGFGEYELKIIDLPGTYSLAACSADESVASDFVLREKPDVVINIVDASNLERNLYLYTQLAELDVPVVIGLNMTDVAREKGFDINYKELSRNLGRQVVPMVGSRNQGTKELLEAVVREYQHEDKLKPARIDYGIDVNVELDTLLEIIGSDEYAEHPARWVAVKLLEGDSRANELVAGNERLVAQAEKSRAHLKAHFGDDPDCLLAARRYGFISGVCTPVVRLTVEKGHDLSDRIDRFVLSRFLGLPIFAAVMYSIFWFTFTVSEPVVGWTETFFEWLAGAAGSVLPDGLLSSFVVEGVIGGVGGVLGFFPLVLFMFMAIAFFEDSGYMARAAFVMDRVMQRFGLHGKSFLPLMISTNGCAVPGLMATRTLESPRERMITMMVIPFMICGAKLPIFALLIGAFFPSEYGAEIMFGMYALSIALALGSAWMLKTFVLKGESSHFVMELPPYRVPTIKGLLLKMWERGREYLKKAGTIVLLLSVIIWAGFTFPRVADDVAPRVQLEQSFAGRAGKIIEPLIKPLGMNWRDGIALITGLAAKEMVVSTFGTMYALDDIDVEDPAPLREQLASDPDWSPLKALAFMIFCMVYLPCVVAIAVFFRESGSSYKWLAFLFAWTTAMAWILSFIVYQGGMLLGLGG